MYKCPECGEVFEEPNYMDYCLEEYNGVSSLFGDRHYATYASCPNCGEAINTDYDYFFEEEEDE